MKATQTQALDFLKKIGVDVELVDDNSDFDEEAALTSVDQNRTAILKPLIEKEAKEEALKESAGKHGGALRSMLARQTGMSRGELAKIESDEDALKAAIQHKTGILDSEKEDIQKKIDAILETHKNEVEALRAEKDKEVSAANSKYIRRDIISYIRSQLDNAPLAKTANKEIIAEDIYNHLSGNHHLGYNEAKKQVDLFLKDDPAMPLMNEAKNAVVTVMDEAKQFLSVRGLWQEDLKHINPSDEMGGKTKDLTPSPTPIKQTNNIAQKKTAFMDSLKTSIQGESV